MWSENEVQAAIGKTVYSGEGEKVGTVGQVFLDDRTGRPEFIAVNTGLFGTSESFVPVEGASVDGEGVTVPYGKDKVKDAPRVEVDENHLEESDERRLFAYYGRGDYDQDAGGNAGERVSGGGDGHDTSGPNTDEAMTRSEERLQVGTESESVGRARLRKYVTTETESVEVPVRKERAVLESEPVDASNVDAATDGPPVSEEEHEVVLNEERVTVDKEAVPVERVRLGTETVTDHETVSDEVRKEQIEVEGDVDERR